MFALVLLAFSGLSWEPCLHAGEFRVGDDPARTLIARAPIGSRLSLSCHADSPSALVFFVRGEERELPPGNSVSLRGLSGDVTIRALEESGAQGSYEYCSPTAGPRNKASWMTTAERGATLWESDRPRAIALTVSIEADQADVTVQVWRGEELVESFAATASCATIRHVAQTTRIVILANDSSGTWTYAFPATLSD